MKKEKMLYRAYDGLFMNSKVLFVEYTDIIRAPYLILLKLLSSSELPNGGLKKPFDISPIKGLTSEELVLWYYQRKDQNPLVDLIPKDQLSQIKLSDIDAFMERQIESNPEVVDVAFPLNFTDVIGNLFLGENQIADRVLIYHPIDNPVIRADVEKTFHDMPVEFVYGDIGQIIKDFKPATATYVFSDVTNITVLADMGKLEQSSILVPAEYSYNFNEEGEWKIDFGAYQKDTIFKIDFFYATSF